MKADEVAFFADIHELLPSFAKIYWFCPADMVIGTGKQCPPHGNDQSQRRVNLLTFTAADPFGLCPHRTTHALLCQTNETHV